MTYRRITLIICTCALLISCGREQVARPVADNRPAANVAALTARVADLEQQAQRLRDINDIKRLQRAYGYYVDNALWDEVVDLMSNDATFEIGLDGVYKGKDHIRKYLYAYTGGKPGLPAGRLNEHFQLQPVIDVAPDGRTAQGRWRALIMAGTYGKEASWGEGPYENTYVKQDGVWKIKSTHWYETLLVPYAGGWTRERQDHHNGKFASDRVPPDALSSEAYEVWPGAYLPPYHYKNPVTGR